MLDRIISGSATAPELVVGLLGLADWLTGWPPKNVHLIKHTQNEYGSDKAN